jgi:hypothetical protein
MLNQVHRGTSFGSVVDEGGVGEVLDFGGWK